MLCLPCPHCGSRDAAEFGYVDEQIARPDPAHTTPQEWRAYLYQRRNPAGWADELWLHRAGCGRYLAVTRHRVTGEVGTVRDASIGGEDDAAEATAG